MRTWVPDAESRSGTLVSSAEVAKAAIDLAASAEFLGDRESIDTAWKFLVSVEMSSRQRRSGDFSQGSKSFEYQFSQMYYRHFGAGSWLKFANHRFDGTEDATAFWSAGGHIAGFTESAETVIMLATQVDGVQNRVEFLISALEQIVPENPSTVALVQMIRRQTRKGMY